MLFGWRSYIEISANLIAKTGETDAFGTGHRVLYSHKGRSSVEYLLYSGCFALFCLKYFLTRTGTVRVNLYNTAQGSGGGEAVSAGERRQQLLALLCQRRRETIPNLAAELGVCERTIRRDIEALTLTYPIETHCGRYHGGVWMAAWYSITLLRMSIHHIPRTVKPRLRLAHALNHLRPELRPGHLAGEVPLRALPVR